MTLAWVFERQLPADRLRADRLLATCGHEPWWVPELWPLEVANALLVAERRGMINKDRSDSFLEHVRRLPIDRDVQAMAERQLTTMVLGRSHGLSSYDALYLDLTLRLGATLASFDQTLNQAATDLGRMLWP